MSSTPDADRSAAPALLRATTADLPPGVAAALASASPDIDDARQAPVPAGGIPWASAAWGDPANAPIVLVHGVTSSADAFWRIGPAVAASGRHVIAVELPGHGHTENWQGRHRFAETAHDLAGYLRAADLDRSDLAILGHSWGGDGGRRPSVGRRAAGTHDPHGPAGNAGRGDGVDDARSDRAAL